MSGGERARQLGRWGEELVARAMQAKGWRILARNWRCRQGEIDLIAADGRYLVFLEVKQRRTGRYGPPGEAVTAAKRDKLRAAAQQYLLEHPTRLQPRFDVAQVYAPQGMDTLHPRIEYLENAF